MPKTSSIRSAVSIEHRLVTDRQTDTGVGVVGVGVEFNAPLDTV